jgi:hypothetical protein
MTGPEPTLRQGRVIALQGRKRSQCCPHLKYFDERASRMQVLRWKPLVTELEGVNLEVERDTILSTFFLRCELSADAMDLR